MFVDRFKAKLASIKSVSSASDVINQEFQLLERECHEVFASSGVNNENNIDGTLMPVDENLKHMIAPIITTSFNKVMEQIQKEYNQTRNHLLELAKRCRVALDAVSVAVDARIAAGGIQPFEKIYIPIIETCHYSITKKDHVTEEATISRLFHGNELDRQVLDFVLLTLRNAGAIVDVGISGGHTFSQSTGEYESATYYGKSDTVSLTVDVVITLLV
jgi:hypothetical protein